MHGVSLGVLGGRLWSPAARPTDTTTNYALCLYDSNLLVVSLAQTIDIRPNAAWLSNNPDGWQYKDKGGTYAGIGKMTLRPGADGQSKALVVGSGADLPLPIAAGPGFFAQNPNVTVQLVNEKEQCWTAIFTVSKKNEADLDKATLP